MRLLEGNSFPLMNNTILPKNKINESVVKKAPMKILNQPFETTFRLQVSYEKYNFSKVLRRFNTYNIIYPITIKRVKI